MTKRCLHSTALETFALLVIFVRLHSCQELSLRLVIQNRPELSKLASDEVLQNTEVLTYLGNTALKNTMFLAPSNDAFNALPQKLQLQLRYAGKQVLNNIFQYHLVPGVNFSSPFNPFSVPEGQQTRALTLYRNLPLYISKIDGVVYIDGTAITMANLTATNGVIHVVDTVLMGDGPRPLALSSNCYDYITQVNPEPEWDASSMFKIFNDYQLGNTIVQSGPYGQLFETVLKNSMAFCTVFLPSNEFLRLFKIRNQDLYSRINGQTPSLLKQVVESLVIPQKAYHLSLLEKLTSGGKVVDAVIGQIRAYQMDGTTYVSNRCGQAKVVSSDITTSNCVIHVIDNFLGLVTTDLYNETFRQTDLQEFTRTILLARDSSLVQNLRAKGGPEYVVPESEKFTLFAPTNGIFQHVDFSKNGNEVLLQLSMLISPRLVDLSYLKDGEKMVVDTMRSGFPATITRVKQAYYVEVNHVKAWITKGDLCTTNGFLHKVDRIVGLPEGTIGQYLNWWLELRRLLGLVEQTGLMTMCGNREARITLFAPNDSAVANIDPAFQGQQNKNKLTRLMYSHMGATALYLESIPDGSSAVVQTLNGDVTVSRSGEDYWVNFNGEKIRIIRGNIGASNGVVHVIERFLPYYYGRAPGTSSFLPINLICFVFKLLENFNRSEL